MPFEFRIPYMGLMSRVRWVATLMLLGNAATSGCGAGELEILSRVEREQQLADLRMAVRMDDCWRWSPGGPCVSSLLPRGLKRMGLEGGYTADEVESGVIRACRNHPGTVDCSHLDMAMMVEALDAEGKRGLAGTLGAR